MKRKPSDSRYALSALRLSLALSLATFIPLLLYGSTPAWWSQRGVLVSGANADDFSPVNQGQLKNIAKAAMEEMDANLPKGAGRAIHDLVGSWPDPATPPDDFAPVNLGQLKTVAKPFYDRLIAEGLVDFYPWLGSANPPDDFSVANIGQVKNLFSFEIPTADPPQDPLGDRIASAASANLALDATGIAWIWGDYFGNYSFDHSYPRRLTGLSALSSVSAGDHHLVVLRSGGTVWTWGQNDVGQLGDGTNANRTAPAAVPNLTSIKSVKAGGNHTLALQQDGSVLAWGDNYYGQLGTGDMVGSSVPVPVLGLAAVRKVAAGVERSMALKEDGTVWTWGHDENSYATGNDLSNPTAAVVQDLTGVVDIGAGYEHAVAVKSDGSVWAWGSNSLNQIGNGNPWSVFQATPVQVPNLAGVTNVATRWYHSLALLNDGTVWAWGYNAAGQLGDGTTQTRQAPVQVSGLTGVVAISADYSYSMAMKSDGTVWVWGDGSSGTLPGVDLRVPQQVGLGLFDPNNNGMDERWEYHYFGDFNHAANDDSDGDGISNLNEFLSGTDPNDYFNGATPILQIVSGNNQFGDAGTIATGSLIVRVKFATGQPAPNAPVTFSISSGDGQILSGSGASSDPVIVRADSNGSASVQFVFGESGGVSSRVRARTGTVSNGIADFRLVTNFHPAPTPSPTPDPNASPTPTPSPTATPITPYRYAIIDLGRDLYPKRINNKGQVLLVGSDANGQWGNFRWSGGTLERLNYTGPQPDGFDVEDINDAGAVVGRLRGATVWINGTENELEAGLFWPADNPNAIKISAPSALPSIDFRKPGSFRKASLYAINNQNDLFGEACTGTVHGWVPFTILVMNSQKWPGASSPPVQLSHASAINDAPDSNMSNWQGSSDTIRRANSEGHYIGSSIISSTEWPGILRQTQSGMIDGQAVSFNPKDINEAGIVVGSAGADMIVYDSPSSQVTISGAGPLAINRHTHPVPSPAAQFSPAPTPIPAPQILAWVGNALTIWERQEDGHTWHPFGLEEMIPSMDGWEYLNPYDMNDTGAIVGTAWYTDPSNPQAQGEYHAFLLVPVELMVDGNGDGQMSFDDPLIHDADQTSEEKPYRFWVNDDQDAGSGANNSEEVTPPEVRDNQDERIQSVRDCEDLARIWLNISGLTEGFKTGAFKLVLRFRNITSGNPAVRVFRAAENGGRGYVTNEGWGNLQASTPFNRALPGTNGPGIASSTTGIHVDRQFWQGIDESSPIINLLFEGVDEGKGELYFEIISDAGRRIGESAGVWLDIKNVQKMYERAKAQPEDIVAPYTVDMPFVGPANYVADPNGNSFEKAWNETNQCVVFVHGWNVSYDEYVGVAQTTFKRLWHQGFKGHFATFRWDTRKSDNMFDAGEYNRSENRAYIYGAALRQWASRLSDAYTVNLIGHSMGNVVCGEALRQGLGIRNYLLMEAAIPMSCYVADAQRLPRLESVDSKYPTPDYHLNPTTNESTRGYRGYISNVTAHLINFYNEADWALASGTSEIAPGLPNVETNWERNQIDYKPDGEIPGVIHAGMWRYYYDSGQGSAGPVEPRAYVDSVASHDVRDSWEMKAFVARSRTKAAGAFPGGGSLGAAEDLRGSFGFRDIRTDHSGQFTRDIQAVDALYKRIRERIEE